MDAPVKAIIQFKQPGDNSIFFADMLEGIDYTKSPPMYTDSKGGSIKVGIYGKREPDGTTKSVRYTVKTLYPDQTFIRTTVSLAVKGLWYQDLQKIYKRKLKTCKNEKDIVLKRRKMGRLLNWCNANFLFNESEKVVKELDKAEKPTREEKSEMEGIEPEVVEFDPSEKHAHIKKVFGELPDAGEIVICSSQHITIATDYVPEKTMQDLLDIGERVIKDFKVFMYDSSLEKAKLIPDDEILRIYHFKNITTIEAAFRRANTLSYIGAVTDEERLEWYLASGSLCGLGYRHKHPHRTALSCAEREDPKAPGKFIERGVDFDDHMVHNLGHGLIANRLRPIPGGKRYLMPWLDEGMAIYLNIKHLGTKNCTCVDLATEKKGGTRSAPTKKKKKKGYDTWVGDIEAMVNDAALGDEADDFMTMLQIPAYNKMKPETMAKAYSTLDFMIEADRVGFLIFLEDVQKHTGYLFKRDGLRKFYDGMDGIIEKCLTGATYKKGRKLTQINNVESLEDAWRKWASEFVIKQK